MSTAAKKDEAIRPLIYHFFGGSPLCRGEIVSMRSALWRGATAGFRVALSLMLRPLGVRNRDRCLLDLSQSMVPVREVSIGLDAKLKFYCPSYDSLFRADQILTKEPETLRWIDSFAPGDVFWDIGANVGVYSLYAAKMKGAKVMAFEPSAANYWLLNKNIEQNGLDRQIRAYCLAMSAKIMCGAFNMADTDLGGACYSFGSEVQSFHYSGLGQRNVVFHQGMMGFSIDQFLESFAPEFPNHIKIDVDGIEEQILNGATATLRNSRLRSVSVELDASDEVAIQRVLDLMARSGLTLRGKEHAPEFDTGASKNIFNYLFARTERLTATERKAPEREPKSTAS